MVAGIATDSFVAVACFGHSPLSQPLHFGRETTFVDAATGFVALLSWAAKQHVRGRPRRFVVEATGVYYEEPAIFYPITPPSCACYCPIR